MIGNCTSTKIISENGFIFQPERRSVKMHPTKDNFKLEILLDESTKKNTEMEPFSLPISGRRGH